MKAFLLLALVATMIACSDKQEMQTDPQQLVLEPGECTNFYGSFIKIDDKYVDTPQEYKICNNEPTPVQN